MTTSNKGTTLDKSSKVSFWLLGVLLTASITGSFYVGSIVSTFTGELQSTNKGMSRLEIALNKNTGQIILDGKERAVLQVMYKSLERRVTELERKK